MKKSQLKQFIKEEIKSTLAEQDDKTDDVIKMKNPYSFSDPDMKIFGARDDAMSVVQELARNFNAAQMDFLDLMKELQGKEKLANPSHEKEFGQMWVDLAKARDAESKIIAVMHKYIENNKDFKYKGE